MLIVYGIPNCDTCRKARKWLDGQGIAHRFHDLRADGLPAELLAAWIAELGWEALLNRRGTTWRKLPEDDKRRVDEAGAGSLMQHHPTLIKRPVFDLGDRRLVGFGEAERDALGRTGTAS